MPYPSPQLLQRMNAGAYSRNGIDVPDESMRVVPCWAWALAGAQVGAEDPFSAASLYNDAFVFDGQRRPIAISQVYLAQIGAIWPDAGAPIATLEGRFADALAGNAPAQQACRMALMKIAAITNGLTVLGEGTGYDCTVQMRSTSWYGWDHWAIAVRMPPGGANAVNYVQTVPDILVRYRCDQVWDAHMPLTAIGIDGLLPAHIDVLERIA
ncbi:hypothetical protein QFW77_18720 [Luteimonas sp. RD2P54]|uniref:Uncharacterized protein n=1 Tax=Luteimonas endophytica TaxID=3042023 RepID=A0ABT6JEM0_9GAMM|nr:hypothetical protein [Luteimonas endophytica]MDH5825005.1 hypothetical protein [Luteimonas endophytica]